MNHPASVRPAEANPSGPLVRDRPKPDEAFTFIELLVVVAALAVLLLMILPVMAHPQGLAQRTVCSDNLRRLMQATTMYATDNRDFLPEPNWNAPWSNPGWLYDAKGGFVPPPTLSAYQGGLLWPYTKDTDVYRCPLDSTNAISWNGRANKLSTYLMNGAVCGYGSISGSSWRLSQFKPSAFCLTQALESSPQDFNDGCTSPAEAVSRAHSQMTPIGTFGGAVNWFPVIDYYKEGFSPGKNLAWCNPATANGR